MVRRRSVLSHLLTSYGIPREVIPSSTNALMIIKYILKQSQASSVGLKHALQVAQALKITDESVYLNACQARLRDLQDIWDVLSVVPREVSKRVKTRIVNQCVELFNQPEGVEWAMKSHWAEIAVSLLSSCPQNLGECFLYGVCVLYKL